MGIYTHAFTCSLKERSGGGGEILKFDADFLEKLGMGLEEGYIERPLFIAQEHMYNFRLTSDVVNIEPAVEGCTVSNPDMLVMAAAATVVKGEEGGT